MKTTASSAGFAREKATLTTLSRFMTGMDRLEMSYAMPTPETVDAFVALVESTRTVEAMERFYAEQASMRENLGEPRVGKAELIAHEEAALASIRRMQAACVRPVFIEGDHVVIRWVFDIEDTTGKTVRFEELAYQRWEGEQLVQEQFFYDPAKLRAAGEPANAAQ